MQIAQTVYNVMEKNLIYYPEKKDEGSAQTLSLMRYFKTTLDIVLHF
jgi:hypothetical protein